MKLFLSATLAVMLGIMGQAPRIYAATTTTTTTTITYGSSGNIVTSAGTTILGGGSSTVNINDIYQKLNVKQGNKITVAIDSLKNLIADSAGNVDVGPFLQHFSIGNGKYEVNQDVVRNLPTDANGKIDLLTLLEYLGIGFTYGSQSGPLQVNVDDLYQKLGFNKGSTITLNVNSLKNLHPDSFGNVDVGPFFQLLGVGNGGSHIISFDTIKTLPTDANGNINLLTILNRFNIAVTGHAPEAIQLNIEEILSSLRTLSATNGGKTFTINVSTIKNLQPNSQNEVDLGPLLSLLGQGNGGSYTINYDYIKNLQAGSSHTVDLLPLLEKLINGGGSTTVPWTVEQQKPIDINVLISLLRQTLNNGGSTMTINIQNLRPDANNQVDIGPLLIQLGLINGGSYMINYETIKNLSTGSSGTIYLTSLIQLLEQQVPGWENVKPVEQTTSLPDIPTLSTTATPVTALPDIPTLPTTGNVNPGTSLPDIPTLPTTGQESLPDIPYWQPDIPMWETSLPDIPMWNP